MAAYIIRRLLRALLILFGVSVITYLLLFLLPSDPARQVAGRTASVQQVEQVRQQLGVQALGLANQSAQMILRLFQ